MKEKLGAWLRYYLPLGVWLLLIYRFSTGAFSSDFTGGFIERLLRNWCPSLYSRLSYTQLDWLNFGTRKLAHLTEYAVLATLVCRAYVQGQPKRYRTGYLIAFLVAALNAGADEAHQALYANRTSTIRDVFLDWFGAMLGIAVIWLWERKRVKCPTSVSQN